MAIVPVATSLARIVAARTSFAVAVVAIFQASEMCSVARWARWARSTSLGIRRLVPWPCLNQHACGSKMGHGNKDYSLRNTSSLTLSHGFLLELGCHIGHQHEPNRFDQRACLFRLAEANNSRDYAGFWKCLAKKQSLPCFDAGISGVWYLKSKQRHIAPELNELRAVCPKT